MVAKRNTFIIVIPEDLPQQWEFLIPVQKNDAWQADVLSHDNVRTQHVTVCVGGTEEVEGSDLV